MLCLVSSYGHQIQLMHHLSSLVSNGTAGTARGILRMVATTSGQLASGSWRSYPLAPIKGPRDILHGMDTQD